MTDENHEQGGEWNYGDESHGLDQRRSCPRKRLRAQCRAHHPEQNIPKQQREAAFRVKGHEPGNGAADAHDESDG
jgi:hypothetical protein